MGVWQFIKRIPIYILKLFFGLELVFSALTIAVLVGCLAFDYHLVHNPATVGARNATINGTAGDAAYFESNGSIFSYKINTKPTSGASPEFETALGLLEKRALSATAHSLVYIWLHIGTNVLVVIINILAALAGLYITNRYTSFVYLAVQIVFTAQAYFVSYLNRLHVPAPAFARLVGDSGLATVSMWLFLVPMTGAVLNIIKDCVGVVVQYAINIEFLWWVVRGVFGGVIGLATRSGVQRQEETLSEIGAVEAEVKVEEVKVEGAKVEGADVEETKETKREVTASVPAPATET